MSTNLLSYNEICARYAKALIKILDNDIEQKKCIEMYEELIVLKNKSEIFSSFLRNPMIPAQKKLKILNKLSYKLKIDKKLFNFLCVLCKHNRLFALEMIYRKVDDIIKLKKNTVKLDLITTQKVEVKILNNIKKTISDLMKKSVVVNNVIDNYDCGNKGFRLITNSGDDGNQDVPHFHVHVLGGKNLGRMIK